MADVIPIRNLVLHEQVARKLRAMLVEGRIAAGAKLNERELSERLQVSRTPLREAIRQLAAEGLVALLPHRGAGLRARRESFAPRAAVADREHPAFARRRGVRPAARGVGR